MKLFLTNIRQTTYSPNTISLVHISYEDGAMREKKGLCSNWLANLERGDALRLFVRK